MVDKFLIQTIVYRQIAADNQYVWLETSLRRQHEMTDGGEANIIAVMRDITERVRVTADLDHFKRILDCTLDLIIMFDPDKLLLVYVNGGALSMLRYRREVLLGETVGVILSSISSDEFLQRLLPLRQSKDTVFLMELELRRYDDTMLLVEPSCQFVPAGDGPGVYIVIARDIGERAKIDRMKEEFLTNSATRFSISSLKRTAWRHAKKGGTGLGLAISKSIVEQRGGIIGFESEVNRGTLFLRYFIQCSHRRLIGSTQC